MSYLAGKYASQSVVDLDGGGDYRTPGNLMGPTHVGRGADGDVTSLKKHNGGDSLCAVNFIYQHAVSVLS